MKNPLKEIIAYVKLNNSEKRISNLILIIIFCCVVLYFVVFQFVTPVLYSYDAYYHLAVSRFVQEHGPRYDFHWTQFSTFKDFYSDKDFLLHVLTIPFLHLSDNMFLAAKYAIIFLNLLFLFVYIFILKRYLPSFLAGLFLLLPAVSSVFSIYFLYLRPTILANILTILGIFFLINKKWISLGFVALIYPLTHISFPTLIIFAIICEIIRWRFNGEFFARNLSVVAIGLALGCAIHPNYPNNLVIVYLNAFLVPLYSMGGVMLDFGKELFSYNLKKTFIANFAVFATINLVLWLSFWKRVKVSFTTFVWWACLSVYLLLAIFSNRHWYPVNVLCFLFFASYVNDLRGERQWRQVLPKINYFIIFYAVIIVAFLLPNRNLFHQYALSSIDTSTHYENVGRWMQRHIPAGETIYHANWSDSPIFICLNPKNNYLVVLDPIYMYYHYPDKYLAYWRLKYGAVKNPHKLLQTAFKANYGYTDKKCWLGRVAVHDTNNFEILYEDDKGIVFKVL